MSLPRLLMADVPVSQVMDTMSRHGTELVVLVEAFEPRSNIELVGEALAGAAVAAAAGGNMNICEIRSTCIGAG